MKLKWNRLAAVPSTLGATGDKCTPDCTVTTDVKPYMYLVSENGESYIAKHFGPVAVGHGKSGCGGWGLLSAANPQISSVISSGGDCILEIGKGSLIHIPAAWPDPSDTSGLVCADGKPYPACSSSGGTTKAGMGAGLILALVAAGAVVVYAVTRGGG